MQRNATISDIIVLTGPESCGKTTLANSLCETLQAPLVPEVSRDYLNQKISRDSHFQYSEPDLLEIASQQFHIEQIALNKSPNLLICDTDLLVLIVWSEVRFGYCHQWILDTFQESLNIQKRQYFLCDHNVPWEADPLRESADSREELFHLYQQKLEHYQLDYSIIAGSVSERMDIAMGLLEAKVTTH